MHRVRSCACAVFGIALLHGCATGTHSLVRTQERLDQLIQERKARTAAEALREGAAAPFTKGEQDELKALYREMLAKCDEAMSLRRGEATKFQWWAMGIAIAGAAAGAAVPVLTTASALGNAEWIAGLGTVSGASNSLQMTMRSVGFTYEGEAQTRQSFITDWKVTLDEYQRARLSNNFDAVAALYSSITTCITYKTALNAAVTVAAPSAPPGQPTRLFADHTCREPRRIAEVSSNSESQMNQ